MELKTEALYMERKKGTGDHSGNNLMKHIIFRIIFRIFFL